MIDFENDFQELPVEDVLKLKKAYSAIESARHDLEDILKDLYRQKSNFSHLTNHNLYYLTYRVRFSSEPMRYDFLEGLITPRTDKLKYQQQTIMTTEIKDILKNCTVEDTVVKLPEGHLDKKLYQNVANALQGIGGKWKGGKVGGFVFPSDPTELLQEIATGVKRNLKKEYQFFATPDALADEIVKLAAISEDDTILEPSAGSGSMIAALHRHLGPCVEVDVYEPMPMNKTILKEMSGVNWLGDDFLQHTGKQYSRIIANPPFSKNQDIRHISHMYLHLAEGGRLVSISSKHWQHTLNREESSFRQFLEHVGAEIIDVPAGTFKESGTNIESCIIIIDN